MDSNTYLEAMLSRRCPALGLSPIQVCSAFFMQRRESPLWFDGPGHRFALTQSGRAAIALLPQILNLHPGDEVLVCAYNCGTEVEVLLRSGLSVRCVESDNRGFLDVEALQSAISDSTRMVYIIHPFGWPHPMPVLPDRMHVVEDCALALFSNYADGTPIGSHGAASVFSFPKSLPTPDGGAVVWQSSWQGPGALPLPPPTRTLRQVGGRSKSWFLRHLPLSKRRGFVADVYAADDDADMPKHYYDQRWWERRSCSGMTRQILASGSPEEIRQRRRGNYASLAQALKAQGFELLFRDLPDGVCPLCCPVLIESRNRLVQKLGSLGIVTSPWWAGGHRAVNWSSFPIASKLKRTVLPLPIHHQLDLADMEYIADVMRKVA